MVDTRSASRTRGSGARPPRAATVVWGLVVWVLVVVLLAIALLPRHLNWDVALYVHSGQQILRGHLPGLDLVDVNPPMIMFVSVVPAALAKLTGQSPVSTTILVVWFAAALSVAAVAKSLRSLSDRSSAQRALIALAYAGTFLVTYASGQWGQREQLFMLSVVPFFIMRTADHRSAQTWFAVTVGACVGVTATFKPWFIVAIAIVECYLGIVTRSWRRLLRPEMIAAAIGAASLAIACLAIPGIRDEFLGRWLPVIRRGYDEAYGQPIVVERITRLMGTAIKHPTLSGPSWLWAGVALALAVVVRVVVPVSRSRKRLDAVFIIAGATSIIAFIEQGKGWTYQSIPALGFALLSLAAAGGSFVEYRAERVRQLRGRDAKTSQWAMSAIGFLVVLTLVATSVFIRDVKSPSAAQRYVYGVDKQMTSLILARSAEGSSVLVIDTSVWPTYPAMLYSARNPGSRFLWTFPIALFARHPRPAEERDFVRDLTRDVGRRRPDLILVRTNSCQGCPAGVSPASYLGERKFFALLAEYREVQGPPEWTIYRRVGQSR